MNFNGSKPIILVLGAQGNLGSQIVNEFNVNKYAKVVAWTRKECDLTNIHEVEIEVNKIRPSVIINTVAYNDVDGCENNLDEQHKAIRLNIQLVECLARVCQEIKAHLIHFSTNYVFSGEASSYSEYENTSPINFYGLTKQLGEEAVLSNINTGLSASVVRIANLFGPRGTSDLSKPSFFETIAKAAQNREFLNVVNDEVCCFTYTKDVACAVVKKIYDVEDNFMGIFHIVNSGAITWYEAAQFYFKLIDQQIELCPVSGSLFNRAAKRPRSAVLEVTRTIPLRGLKKAMEEYINLSL